MKLTWCINSYKNLPYLKLAVASIRRNAYFKGAPIIVFTENDNETAEWISSQPDITPIIETNAVPKGIGGGANEAIARVETEYFSLIHSDMYISRHYDRPLLDEVMKSDKPTVACAWRLEPNIWGQPSRLGTTMVPTDENGLGVYWHNFEAENFEAFADEFVDTNKISFRKVEGVSYVMRKKDWDRVGGNDPIYAPTSWEDNDLHIRMSALDYNFVVTTRAVVWHFGSRGANFMEQNDKITGRSERQLKAEQANIQKFINKWGEIPTFDDNGFIVLTPTLKERFKQIYEPIPSRR